MHRGTRFADVLDAKLQAFEWQAPATDEYRAQPAPARHVVYTPLYNLHTVTQGAGSDRVTPPAHAADIRGAAAFATAGRGAAHQTPSPEAARPRLDPQLHDAAPAPKRPAFQPLTPPVVTPAQPLRRFTAAQWRSLGAFNQLGAAVGANFSAGELRSAFRELARRYHPDRHPGANAADRQRLAQQFTTARTSYDTLLTALESPIGNA